MLNDDQLMRYSRHILLPQIDVVGQQKLCQSVVLIIGVGGLGSPAAMYLAAAGIRSLMLIDDDKVELSNLQRQIIHAERSVGEAKVTSAGRTLKRNYPACAVQTFAQRADTALLSKLVPQADVVLDCSDNYTTRYLVNAICTRARIPLVSAAAIRFEGQLTVFDSRDPASPCYQCLYPPVEGERTETCSESGVLGPTVGVMGTLQALSLIHI